MKENVIFWSGGKDSTASILLAYENDIKIKEIVFVEVMYDLKRNISGENPEHINWIYNVAIPKIEELGYKVKVLRANKDYLDLFNHKKTRGKYIGKKCGYLLGGMCVANRDLKMKPIRDYKKIHPNITEIVGIAIDEPKRLERLKSNQKSLLYELGYTENMTFGLCKKYNLLSPIYEHSNRGGCWFCPNCHLKGLYIFKKNNPLLWEEFVRLSNTDGLVNDYFKYTKTIKQIDKEIDLYGNQEKYKQMTIDDFIDEE